MMLFLDKSLGTLITHICYSCSTLLGYNLLTNTFVIFSVRHT